MEELILAFCTITTMINTIQPMLESSASGGPKGAQQALPMSKLSSSEARALQILTALAIAFVRKKEVTAVVASHPQRPKDGQVQVIATRQPNSAPMLDPPWTFRNPHPPALGNRKRRTHSQFTLLTPPHDLKVNLSKLLTDLVPS
jgi:hypothetical protein